MYGNIQSPIQIDLDRLTRIFDNIISNSLQYTPSGGNISIIAKAEKIVFLMRFVILAVGLALKI